MTVQTGFSMPESTFPRYVRRRIRWDQEAGAAQDFTKRSAEHLEYSVDLSLRLAPGEEVVSATGESSSEDMPCTWVRFAKYGVVAFVDQGVDATTYTLTITATTNRGRVLTYLASITTYGDANEALDNYVSPGIGDADDPAQNYLTDVNGKFVAPTWVDAAGDILTPNFGTE